MSSILLLWSRKWQPIPVFLLGKFHGQKNLVGYGPWGCKELGMTKHMHARTHTHFHPSAEILYLSIHIATFPTRFFNKLIMVILQFLSDTSRVGVSQHSYPPPVVDNFCLLFLKGQEMGEYFFFFFLVLRLKLQTWVGLTYLHHREFSVCSPVLTPILLVSSQ